MLVAVGANLGDPAAQIDRALAALGAVPGVEVLARSPLHTTRPVGGPSQADFRNGAVKLRTTLPALALLAVFKELERQAGRDFDGVRDGPRPLDLDLLTYGDQRIDARLLSVPHPRMLDRDFVLAPLADLGVTEADLPPAAERPRVVADPEELRATCRAWVQRGGCRVGLVPTMGALHDGHASLIRRAREECDRVVVTVFVNPLQFGAGEDLERYPRPFEADLARCRAEGADLVFAPPVESMYPTGFCSTVDVGGEAEGLEGGERPGHFRGVATVVARLWSLCGPDRAYFGQKDAQQVAVLRRLHADLGLSGELVECAIVREPDGLALSSRNVYLSAEDRAAAVILFHALAAADRAWQRGVRRVADLLGVAGRIVAGEPRGRLDYLECRRAEDLAVLPDVVPDDGSAVRLLLAVRFGEPSTRLLDNAVLGRGELEGGV